MLVINFNKEENRLFGYFEAIINDYNANSSLETHQIGNFIKSHNHGVIGSDVEKFLNIIINKLSLDLENKDVTNWHKDDNTILNNIERKLKSLIAKNSPDKHNTESDDVKKQYSEIFNKLTTIKQIIILIKSNKSVFKDLKYDVTTAVQNQDYVSKIEDQEIKEKLLKYKEIVRLNSKKPNRYGKLCFILGLIPIIGPIISMFLFKRSVNKIYRQILESTYRGEEEKIKDYLASHIKNFDSITLQEVVALLNNEKDEFKTIVYNQAVVYKANQLPVTNIASIAQGIAFILAPILCGIGLFLYVNLFLGSIPIAFGSFVIYNQAKLLYLQGYGNGMMLAALKSEEEINLLAKDIYEKGSEIDKSKLLKVIDDFITFNEYDQEPYIPIQGQPYEINIIYPKYTKDNPDYAPKGTNHNRYWTAQVIIEKSLREERAGLEVK